MKQGWRSIAGSVYEFDDRSGASIRVRGGGLSRVVRAKFVLVGGGMPRLVGLESDGDEPLTARLLREPRVTEMEAAFAAYLDADRREDEAEERHDNFRVLDQMRESRERWLADLVDTGDVRVTARGRGSSPPSEAELRAFAATFTRQQAVGRGAIPRTAREIKMNRSTVYRWIELCRDSGLLPPREGN